MEHLESTQQRNIEALMDQKPLQRIDVGQKTVYLLGTAHVSKESVEDVRRVVEAVNPDTICVELCNARFHAHKNPDQWKNMDIFQVVKDGRSFFLLAQLVMTAFYRRIGEKLDAVPGGEMFEGISLAESGERQLVLADRDVQVTLKRLWGNLGWWQKFKLPVQLFLGLFESEEIEVETIEKMKELDQLESAMNLFAQGLPGVKETLIDERDIYLSQKIREASGTTVLAVLGAGHVAGVMIRIQESHPIEPLDEIPAPSNVLKILQWAIPIAIIILFCIGFLRGGVEHSVTSIGIWVILNGVLSALGVVLALGHPLAILSAFIAAPLTSLNPMIAAGWVSGLVQAWARRPRVSDFEKLGDDLMSVKGFWTNPVSRILLVVALANLGSGLGTFVAGSWIAARTFQ